MGEMSSYQLGVIGALFLSVASSVSIVICNKALMSHLGFPFGNFSILYSLLNDGIYGFSLIPISPSATTLTSWHLMVTFCTLHAAQRFNLFESKPIDMKTVVLFGILNGVSIGLLNLSLGFNSIGFYQMTKLAIIPFTVLLETIFLKKQFSQNIKLSLLLLLVGVGIASITDLQLNFVGTILSLLAIITTCVGQIAFIILSCIISVSVNFSTFLVIGKTSPVTYQVLGHLKTCLVLTFGYTLLHDPFTDRNIVGILIAIFGMGLYSYFCTQENKKKQADPLGAQMKEKDAAPFLGPQKEGHEVKNLNKDSLV
ncbi:hypothetical protein Gotur_015542 [Gossypium turneri]